MLPREVVQKALEEINNRAFRRGFEWSLSKHPHVEQKGENKMLSGCSLTEHLPFCRGNNGVPACN